MKRENEETVNLCIECRAKLPDHYSNVCRNCLERILQDTEK